MRVYGLGNRVVGVTLLTTGEKLAFRQDGPELLIDGLPAVRPTPLFPVIRIECDSVPRQVDSLLARERLWSGDASRYSSWARQRGTTVNVLK
jgi:alpha-L-fucosidase